MHSYSKVIPANSRCFTRRHPEEQIACAFEEIVEEYRIPHCMSFIITDNVGSMKCAFLVQMPQQRSDEGASEEENLDADQLIEDISSEEDAELPWSTGENLFCFAQSLKLFVNDGMKTLRNILAISETSQFTDGIASLLVLGTECSPSLI